MRALRWLRWAAHVSGRKFRDLAFMIRLERGELGNRLHAHVLIVVPEHRLGFFVLPSGMLPLAARRWDHGMTKFRRVMSDDPTVAYMLKETCGASEYELTKSERAPHVVLSHAARRHACSGTTGTASVGGDDRSGLHTDGVPAPCLRGRESLAP